MCQNTQREASCLCGELKVMAKGEPAMSIACNCKNCQRRSGSPFGAITYFSKEQLTKLQGETRQYQFTVESGRQNTVHFCPNCGSTVMMETAMMKGLIGIGAGSFNDPDMPPPKVSVWARSKYKWVDFPDQCQQIDTQPLA